MTRHFSARLRLGKRGRALALGSLSPHTFAWGPNPFVNSSGFNHTFESGQAPDNTYPNPGNGGNMLSDSGSSLEPSYLATQDEGASLCNATDLFGEAPPGLSSAPSYAHANPQVPQHPSFPPALPVPLDGHRICEYSSNAGYNHAIASGVCMDDLTQLIPTRTPIRGWRTPHHPTAAAPFAPRRQQVNVLQPRELRNPSYGAPKERHQPFDAPGRPTHLSYTSDEFQNPGTSRTALLVHQPPGPDTFAGPIFIDQTPIVGRNPWTQQLPHEERSIPSNDLPTQVADAALPDLAGTIPPAPILVVPRSSEALEPSSKTCLVCERVFRRPYLLKDHMASCHSQQGQGKSYPCDYPGCTSAYTTHSNMMRHRNKRHSRVDNLTAPVLTQSADAERNFVGLGGLGVLETQNASESQYLTQILAAPPVGGSALTGEAVSVQQSAPGSPTLSTTGLSFLDELLASAASRKGRKWARARRR